MVLTCPVGAASAEGPWYDSTVRRYGVTGAPCSSTTSPSMPPPRLSRSVLAAPATSATRSEPTKSGWWATARQPAASAASSKRPSSSVVVVSAWSRSSQPTEAFGAGCPSGSRTTPFTARVASGSLGVTVCAGRTG